MPGDREPATVAAPLTAPEFDVLMAAVGPFEARPRIAVAVSGGSDSMALALLLRNWAEPQGGEIIALTVDHGLRPESAAEARKVGGWLAAKSISHRVLRWSGPRPESGVQAAARSARYRLLGAWCHRHGVLHLAVAHQLEDQAETLLLRLARGSGLDGLAAMAAVSETETVRLIRPLLPVDRARLRATLTAWGQPWIEDPTNRDETYLRMRLRQLLPSLAPAGLSPVRLAATARQLGRARAAIDDAVAALLARAVALFPAGYARLEPDAFAAASREVSLRALARCLMTVGGGVYTPRLDRLERLHAALCGPTAPARTLAGCRMLRHRGAVILCREAAQVTEERAISAGGRLRWDGRFLISIGRGGDIQARAQRAENGLLLRRLGPDGWAQIVATARWLRGNPVPPPVRPTLPALWRDGKVLAVPHLGYRDPEASAGLPPVRIDHAPAHPLASARFTVA